MLTKIIECSYHYSVRVKGFHSLKELQLDLLVLQGMLECEVLAAVHTHIRTQWEGETRNDSTKRTAIFNSLISTHPPLPHPTSLLPVWKTVKYSHLYIYTHHTEDIANPEKVCLPPTILLQLCLHPISLPPSSLHPSLFPAFPLSPHTCIFTHSSFLSPSSMVRPGLSIRGQVSLGVANLHARE